MGDISIPDKLVETSILLFKHSGAFFGNIKKEIENVWYEEFGEWLIHELEEIHDNFWGLTLSKDHYERLMANNYFAKHWEINACRIHEDNNKIVLPNDDLFWKKNFSPFCWNCGCHIISIARWNLNDYKISTSDKINKNGFFGFNPALYDWSEEFKTNFKRLIIDGLHNIEAEGEE